MGLLDHLWDDTVAGPRPDRGLGKLRRHHTFSSRSNGGKGSDVGACGEDSTPEAMRINRSIVIAKPPGYQNDSPTASPTGSTPLLSPFPAIKEADSEGYCPMRSKSLAQKEERALFLHMMSEK